MFISVDSTKCWWYTPCKEVLLMGTIQQNSGVISELLIAAYFARSGWEIFWPNSSQSRSDFVICNDSYCKKIQCKKATKSRAGNYSYTQARLSTRNKGSKPLYKEGDFDIVAFIDDDGQIWLADFKEIEGFTSVCLGSDNPKYTPQTSYDANTWKV